MRCSRPIEKRRRYTKLGIKICSLFTTPHFFVRYESVFKPKALKDLQGLPPSLQVRILEKVELMQEDLQGDVKRLTNFTPEYRLRVGNYRVLFEVDAGTIVIYRIKHRREAYS